MVDTDKKLWELAKGVIDDEDRQNLEFSIQDNLGILDSLKEATTEAQRLCINNRWFFVTPGKGGRKVVIRDLLSKIVTWAEIFTKVSDQGVQYDPGHASLPWAGVRFFLQIAINDIKKFDFVVAGAEQIARKITRCRIFEKLYLDRPSMAAGDLRQALVELYASMITYLARAKRYFEQDTRVRIVKSGLLARGDFEELSMKINAAESEVERYAALVAMGRGFAHIYAGLRLTGSIVQNSINHQMTTLSLDIEENYTTLSDMLSKMDRPISRMSSQLDFIEDHLHELERKRILDWLSTQPYIEHHASINRRVLQGTGQWLLSHQTFRHWRTDSSNSLLWLHGMQGTGKSSLVSIAIKEIGFSENLTPPPVYFYCSCNKAEPERSNATQALACIARQLSILRSGTSLLNPTLASYEGAVHESTATGSSVRRLSLEELCKLIIKLTGHWPMTTIAIDALDECDRDTRGDLIEALETVLQDSTSLVKVLISSREDEDLKYSLQNHPSIQVTSHRNQNDINTFVNTKTDELVAKNRLLARIKSRTSKDDLKSLIKADLIRGAEGMFRWAQLQLQRLQGTRFEIDVRTALASMPRELSDLYDELYERMVSTEYETDRLIVTNVLRWMLCSTRRMTAKDFFTAISLNICVAAEDIDEAMILDLLPEFVLCDESEGNQTFRFAHPSVREFLVKRPEYSTSLSNSFAAEICLLAIIGTSKSPAARQFLHDRKLNPTDMGL